MLGRIVSISLWCFAVLLLFYLGLRIVFGDGFWWLAWLNNFTPYYFIPFFLFLPLTLGLRFRRLSILYLLLACVGFVWVLPRFTNLLSTSQQVTSHRTLKVVTFNILGNNQQLDEAVAWLKETNADVVLLQEIPPDWSGTLISELSDIYPYQVSHPLDVRVWGEAVLSRHPILIHEGYESEETVARERIEIEWGADRIAIYNVHLAIPQREPPHLTLPINNPFLNMLLKYDDGTRNQQADQLLINLEQEALPFVAAGDFNLSDNAVKYAALDAQLTDAFRESGFGMGATWPNAEIAGLPAFIPPILRIDYVWYSDEFRAMDAQVGPPLGSDHLPVVTVLEWDNLE